MDELLDQFNLAEKKDTHVRKLSGGMKRRLLIARALIHSPKILILDEPTAGVDVELRRKLWRSMQELNKEGTTVLLTSHYIEEAERLAKRIGIINHGKIITVGLEAAVLSSLVDTPPAPHEGSISTQAPPRLWRLFFPHLPVGRGWAPEYNPERPNCRRVERAYGGSRLTTDRMLPAKRLVMLPIVLPKLGDDWLRAVPLR